MKYDISIIVPIYNAEKYIKKCIDSIINQTKKEIEIILINDGSKDNTDNIIKEYSDERIKYYNNKNQGIGKTRNFGIKKSTGKNIMFLDSDDYLELDACEKIYNKMITDNLDVVIADYYRCKKEIKEEIKQPSFDNSNLDNNPNIITEHLAPWAKIYNKQLIINNNIFFEEELKYEDAPFVIKTLIHAKKIGKLNECIYNYIIHENSETTIRDRRCFDIFKILDIIRNYSKEYNYLKDKIDRLTVRIITNYTIQQRNQIDKKVAMEFIDEAFKYLEKEVPDYKNNKYFKDRSILKRVIEKNKFLTKIYCKL